MKTRRLPFWILFGLLLAPLLYARVGALPASRVPGERAPQSPEPGSPPLPDPMVVRIRYRDPSDLNQLAGQLDIWEVDRGASTVLALVRSGQFVQLTQAGYPVEIDDAKTAQISQPFPPATDQTSGIPGFPCYRTVEETHNAMSQLTLDYPELAVLIDIGDSWEKTSPNGAAGYDMLTLVLTNQNTPGPKAKFFLMGALHAREYTTAELALRFAEYLLTNYGTDPDVTWLLDHYEVHITPQSNPDGRKIAETGVLWRKNVDNDDGCSLPNNWGTDLNRNSSYFWGGLGSSSFACSVVYRGPAPVSEPETQALQDYLSVIYPDQRGPNEEDPAPDDATGVLVTLHSYGQIVLYPWGGSASPAPNLMQLRTLGRKFGYHNGYEVCRASDCLYLASGITDDWSYGELGVASYTIELGTRFFEECSEFETDILPGHLPVLLYAFKAARRPYLDPAGPESVNPSVSVTTTVAGFPIDLTAIADDTRYDSNGWGAEPVQNILEARYTLGSPSWTPGALPLPMTAADGNFDSPVEQIVATVDTSGLAPGRTTLFVESRDADGNWGVPSAVFLWISEAGYGFEVAPSIDSAWGHAGETITYAVQISNTGTLTDTYGLQADVFDWDLDFPASVGPLGPGQAVAFEASIVVPETAEAGQSMTAVLRIASVGDQDSAATVSLTASRWHTHFLTPIYVLQSIR